MSAEPDVDPGRDPAAADGQRGNARQVSELLAAAARAGWHDRGRILAVAIVVSLCTAGADIIADHIFDPGNNPLSIVGTLSVEVISLFGTILISGFVCRLVTYDRYAEVHSAPAQSGADQPDADQRREDWLGEDQPASGQAAADRRSVDQRTDQAAAEQAAEDPVTVGRVVRTLPWTRLAVADILAAILIGIGLLLLVIPGLVVLNFLAVLGPVIELERRRVLAALRRSARLVRQHFWWVVVLITVPAVALGELESILPAPHSLPQILEVLAARGLGAAVIQTAIALIVVEVCFWLIDLDARRRPPGD